MPPTAAIHGRELRIKINGSPDKAYYAGDIITGTVERTESTVSPDAAISITLMGRSKVKIVRVRHSHDANGHSHSHRDYYRSRFHFFNAPGHQNRQMLYQGPMHIENKLHSKQEWEFVMQVPFTTGLDPRMEGTDSSCSMLPIDAASVNGHQIPPSNYCNKPEAYIEYHLQADIAYTHKGKRRSEQATLPIIVGGVRVPAPPVQVVGYASLMVQFSNYALNPNIDLQGLSFKQKTKQFFGSSSVPAIAFKVHLYVPKMVQLGSDKILPISARAFRLDHGTTEDMKTLPIKAQIIGFNAKITTRTKAVAPGSFGKNKEDEHDRSSDLSIVQSTYLHKNPLALDVETEPGITSIGEHLQLRLTRHGASVHGKVSTHINPPLSPTFTTYNIACTHSIKYRMIIRLGEKTKELEWEFPLAIVGEPDMTPPPAFNADGTGQQPPPFVQYATTQQPSSSRTNGAFHAFTGAAGPPESVSNPMLSPEAAAPPPAYSG